MGWSDANGAAEDICDRNVLHGEATQRKEEKAEEPIGEAKALAAADMRCR